MCARPATANLVLQVASPVDEFTGTAAHPRIALPLAKKLTVPPSGAGTIDAVRTTSWPVTDCVAEEVNVVAVAVAAVAAVVATGAGRVPAAATGSEPVADPNEGWPLVAGARCLPMLVGLVLEPPGGLPCPPPLEPPPPDPMPVGGRTPWIGALALCEKGGSAA